MTRKAKLRGRRGDCVSSVVTVRALPVLYWGAEPADTLKRQVRRWLNLPPRAAANAYSSSVNATGAVDVSLPLANNASVSVRHAVVLANCPSLATASRRTGFDRSPTGESSGRSDARCGRTEQCHFSTLLLVSDRVVSLRTASDRAATVETR